MPVSILLDHYFTSHDQFFVNATFIKEKELSMKDFIIFDEEGKIYGITKRILEAIKKISFNDSISATDIYQ